MPKKFYTVREEYSGAEFESFYTVEEAIEYLDDGLVDYDYFTHKFRRIL